MLKRKQKVVAKRKLPKANPLLKGLNMVPVLHYLEPLEVLKLQAVCKTFYNLIIGVALQSMDRQMPIYANGEVVGYDIKSGHMPIRPTQRCICKIEENIKKLVMFYSCPLSSDFIEFCIPDELAKSKSDHITLVEPGYLFWLGRDTSDNELFLRYDLITKSYLNLQMPIVTHSDFRLVTCGRSYIFLVGMFSNKIWEKYNILTNEWTLLPPIPVQSISCSWFVENNQYLWLIITPFEVNTKLKKLHYRLNALSIEEDKWEDVTTSMPTPIDFKAKFPVLMHLPAKIVHYPYYYFVDISGTIVIKLIYNNAKKSFRQIENYNYYTPQKRKKMQAKKNKNQRTILENKKRRDGGGSDCLIF